MSKDIRPVSIKFGALSDSIKEQLTQQSLSFDKNEIRHIQQDVDALLRLRVRGFISISATRSVEKKIFREIITHVGVKNNLKPGKNIFK